MFYDLLTIPDPRPSKAHPEHRAARKAIEGEFPHFDAKDLGLKAGVLALMLGIACYPRIKSEQDALEHAAKLKGKEKEKERERERRSDVWERRGGERERRMSEAGGDRRRSCGWEREDYSHRDWEGRSRRR